MIAMDVFNDSAFTAISMTEALDKVHYVPQYLSSLRGLVKPVPVRTRAIFIEERQNAPALIRTTPIGSPPDVKQGRKREARAFQTARVALRSTIYAEELAGVRAFGSETDLQMAQQLIAERQADMMLDFQLTKEHHLLGLIDGRFVDADGSTIYDWATELGQNRQSVINFKLTESTPANAALRKRVTDMRRKMLKALMGIGGANVEIHALCGDEFWDALIAHDEVEKMYLGHSAALQMDNLGGAYETFRFAKVTWHNYRGSDLEGANNVSVPSKECRLFPVNAGIFQMAYAFADTFEFVNTLGREMYSWLIRDKDRDAWVAPEMHSYPLPVCTMPSALFRGKME